MPVPALLQISGCAHSQHHAQDVKMHRTGDLFLVSRPPSKG
jgi:hypothetical protein